MIKILVEGMTEGKGGKESYLINTFREFDREKFHFTFVVYGKDIAYQDELVNKGAELVRLPERKDGLFHYRKALNDLLSQTHYDVLWANKTTLSSCEIIELAKKHRIPLRIIHSHSSSNMGGFLTLILHSINKCFVRKWANMYLACSTDAAKWFYGKKQCRIVKNGINVEKFRFNETVRVKIRQELGVENDFVIGHVGRFGIEKNHQKLIRVFSEIHKMNPNTKLVLCGDGEERQNIETLINDLNLNDSVLLLGVIDNVHEVMQAIDVFVMPSLFEGLPFALLEAQAAGLKCIVSDTVSRDSDIIPGNQFISLDSDDSLWAEQILSIDVDSPRANAADVIKNNGFDIIDCSNEIQLMIENGLNENMTSKGA